jgi:hypothetical protein
VINYWLKSIGASGDELRENWLDSRPDLLDEIRFARNKRPSGVARGDRLVLYAAGWECFFGIAIVTATEAREDLEEPRWPWVLDVTVPLVVPRLDLAPHIRQMDVANTSVRQQSHISLTPEKFQKAVVALMSLVAADYQRVEAESS